MGFVVTAVALAIAIAVCGCGSSSSTSLSASRTGSASSSSGTASATTSTTAASGKFNSCSVVTQAEAARAIRRAVTPGVLGNATVEGGLACVFYGPAAPTPRNANVAQADSVRVVIVRGADALKWYRDYKSKVNAQPVSGYGAQAYYDGYASLSILKGQDYVRIAVAPAGAPPSLPGEKQLAAAILPKL